MGRQEVDTIMTTLSQISTPALILDLDRVETNLRRMQDRATSLGVELRPHIKTHKCLEIAQMQRDLGCSGLTVSTLYEARVFSERGFDDLTWAFPVILNRLEEALQLAHGVDLGLLVDSKEAVAALEETREPLRVWIKVDSGYHRAGVDPESPLARELAERLRDSTTLRFAGLLTHAGHAYNTRSMKELAAVAEQERSTLVNLAELLRSSGIGVPAVSVGSTPTMSVVEDLGGVDEMRPGNYVFFDLMQARLGSCSIDDCAVTVLASVVSSQPGAGHCVIDAGALALSKDGLPKVDDGTSFGEVLDAGLPGPPIDATRVRSLSQEHGILDRALEVGRRVRVLPVHSCLTAACFDEYVVVRGDRVLDRWKIWRGR
jgi:D-serine deaminase-like pyridoxal phosphate-dependent protein